MLEMSEADCHDTVNELSDTIRRTTAGQLHRIVRPMGSDQRIDVGFVYRTHFRVRCWIIGTGNGF